jgi:hypothetical protein
MACCWALGLATLVAWNCMLTIEDYYYKLFPVGSSKATFQFNLDGRWFGLAACDFGFYI